MQAVMSIACCNPAVCDVVSVSDVGVSQKTGIRVQRIRAAPAILNTRFSRLSVKAQPTEQELTLNYEGEKTTHSSVAVCPRSNKLGLQLLGRRRQCSRAEYLSFAVPPEKENLSVEVSTSDDGAGNGGEESVEATSDQYFFQDVRIDLDLPRRRMLIEFTCNVCDSRTQRLINPEAYRRGTVFIQCGGCEAYHQLVDNLNLIQEFDFRKENGSNEKES